MVIYMLNEEKIRLMTKLALYEQKKGKKEIPLSKYYRTDYLTMKMINSAIVMSLGFIMLLAAVIIINVEKLLTELVNMDMKEVGVKLLIIYVTLFVLNMLATYFIESRRFKRSRDSLNRYNAQLKELYKICKREGGVSGFDLEAYYDNDGSEKSGAAESSRWPNLEE